MTRLLFFSFLVLILSPASALAQAAAKAANPKVLWHEVGTGKWEVEGRVWTGEERLRYFDRLPAVAEGKVTSNVWNLSRDSAGLVARFKTDAESLWVDYELRSERLALTHMPASGVSGVDLYARDEADGGQWKWVQVTRPAAQKARVEMITGLRPGARVRSLPAALQRH